MHTAHRFTAAAPPSSALRFGVAASAISDAISRNEPRILVSNGARRGNRWAAGGAGEQVVSWLAIALQYWAILTEKIDYSHGCVISYCLSILSQVL